jgi:hypothetical protein
MTTLASRSSSAGTRHLLPFGAGWRLLESGHIVCRKLQHLTRLRCLYIYCRILKKWLTSIEQSRKRQVGHFAACLYIGGLLALLTACGSSEPQPSGMQIAPRLVNASDAPDKPLSDRFKRLTAVSNPCGTFGGTMDFGVTSDLLSVSCTPDIRTAISNGNNGQFGVVSPPGSAPWRVSINIGEGRELDRLESFTTCSPRLDAFELSLSNGETFFHCYKDQGLSRPSLRVIAKGEDQQPIELLMPNDDKYEYFYVGTLLIRQARVGDPPGPMPFPEIALPSPEPDWRTWRLATDPKACGTVVQETPDRRSLIAVVGRMDTDLPSRDPRYISCIGEQLTFVSAGQDAPKARFEMWPPGSISHTLYDGRILKVNWASYPWHTKYPVANTQSVNGPELSIVTGNGIAPWRYSGVSVIEGHGLIALEVAPRLRLGSRPFLYIVFNWDGEPLARFYATRIALAPDRPRIVVTFGKTIETWDLK